MSCININNKLINLWCLKHLSAESAIKIIVKEKRTIFYFQNKEAHKIQSRFTGMHTPIHTHAHTHAHTHGDIRAHAHTPKHAQLTKFLIWQ